MNQLKTSIGRGGPALLALALAVGACADSSAGGPAAPIEAFIAEYNAGDLDGAMALFAEDAVMIGHPRNPRAVGRDEIISTHADEVGGPGTYTIFNVETDGNRVTWDHRWGGERDGDAFAGCVEGNTATVEDGLITSWTWPDTDFHCDHE